MSATDVPIVDRVTGGVVPGLPLLFLGGAGSGRTVLCLEIARKACERRERVLFITPEPAPGLIQQAESLGVDLARYGSEERLVLLELSHDIAALVRKNGIGAFVATAQREAAGADLVILEDLTALTSELLDMQPLRAAVEATLGWDPACPPRVVVTADRDAIRRAPLLERAIAHHCGALLELVREPNGERFLEVIKSRYPTGHGGRIPFTVTREGIVATDGREATPAPRASAPAAALARRRLLVIDEDGAPRAELVSWLAPHYEVQEVADGLDGLTAVMADCPDLIVLELALPRVSGFDVLRALQSARLPVPTLVLSWRLRRQADRLRPLVLGASDILSKPPTEVELLHRIATLLALPREPRDAPIRAEELLFVAEAKSRILDEDAFRTRLARACNFGAQLRLVSTLAALEATDPDALELLLRCGDARLREEDALLPVSETRALILLVASNVEDARKVVERLGTLAGQGREAPLELGAHFAVLEPTLLEQDFEKLFSSISPLPAEARK